MTLPKTYVESGKERPCPEKGYPHYARNFSGSTGVIGVFRKKDLYFFFFTWFRVQITFGTSSVRKTEKYNDREVV